MFNYRVGKMTTQRLDLQLEEPGDDPLSDQIIDILRNVLQPDSKVSVEVAVTQVTALLPEGRPYSSEIGSFLMTCYEIAEQIPYYHASMVKLVTIIDLCLNSSRFPKVDGSRSMQTDPTMRSQKLSETLRDWWNTSTADDSPAKYISFQSFVARIHERGLTQGYILEIFTLQHVFEEQEGNTQEEREAYVTAALQYLLIGGDGIYQEVTEDVSKQHKWQHWYRQVSAIAAGKVGNKTFAYSQDTVELAGQAKVAMEAIQRLKSG